MRAGEIDVAVHALERAIRDEPNAASHWAAYGVALAKQERYDEACAALDRSTALDGTDIEVWCALAELSISRYDLATAVRALARCVALDAAAVHPSGIRARALVRKTMKMLERAS
jgi:cytochrome c-type biogenesis protein CcmH/NrfG